MLFHEDIFVSVWVFLLPLKMRFGVKQQTCHLVVSLDFCPLFCVLGLRYVVHLVHLLPSNAIVVSHFHNYTFSISLITVTLKKFGLFSECYRSIQGSFKQRSRPSRCLYKSCSSFQVNFSNSPLLLKH